MARHPGREATYRVADLFRQRCLIDSRSLLWPDQAIWTVENLDVFWNAFVGNPDVSGDSFISKLEKQLANESSSVHQIAADILVMYCLPVSSGKMGRDSKRNLIETVMAWKVGEQSGNAEWLEIEPAFAAGIADPGMFYMIAGRPWHVAYLLRFGRACRNRQQGDATKESTTELADEIFSEFTSGQLEVKANVAAGRHFLLHLLYPDEFENIASSDHKRRIFTTFAEESGVEPSTDVDDGLFAIREFREATYGPESCHYYSPNIRVLWDNGNGKPPPPPPPPDTPPLVHSVEVLATKTHLDASLLHEIESLLTEKRQIIFEGPPGSGKTYVAELFARWFTGQEPDGAPTAHVEIVQFHQSYGYEDFVQGIRPETNTQGQLTYNVRDGVFLELCRRAADEPEAKFVLLIDEINRGNISRIFGELILLLEYRDKRARLPYATGANPYLTIPKNLYIIGTMNSADRSLAQVDYALRRRFYFVRFMPVEHGQAIVLDRWLQAQELDVTTRQHVLARFVALNERVSAHLSQDYQIGHSFFMHPKVGVPEGFDRIWTRAIHPLLEEYFHHHRDRDSILEEIRLLVFGAAPDAIVMTGDDVNDASDEANVE